MAHTNIAFFYPAEHIGGAQVLFSRVGVHLYKAGFEVSNLDFGNSFISNYFSKANIEFNHIIINKFETDNKYLLGNLTLVIPASYIFDLNKYFLFSESTKIMIWDLHPHNIIQHTAFSKVYKNDTLKTLPYMLSKIEKDRFSKINELLTLAHNKNSLYFMCHRNFSINADFFHLKFVPNYLPICQILDNKNTLENYKVENEINIGWVSRLATDKVNILNLLIKDLESFSKSTSHLTIKLHIIGDGQASNNIVPTKYIEVIKVGRIDSENLSVYISQNIDLGFSMGTSALEFAALSIPTLLVPSSTLFNYYKNLDKKYIWLHKVGGYDVATEIRHSNEALSVENILFDLAERGLPYYSKKSYQYVKENHSLLRIVSTFQNQISNVQLTYKDFEAINLHNSTFLDSSLMKLKDIAKRLIRYKI